MNITIKEELLGALTREATIANRTDVEYVEMIINSHLAEKKKFRLLSDIEFVGIDVVAPSVDTLRVEKEVEIETARVVEEERVALELLNNPIDENSTTTPPVI